MSNILLLLAVLGMVVGVYAVAMPTLTRRGWRLPFASFFSDSPEVDDEPFTPSFELPHQTDVPVVMASTPAPVIEETILPPVLRPADIDEDDPTLTPLFEELVVELEQIAPTEAGATPDAAATAPHLVLVPGATAEVSPAAEAALDLAPEEPEAEEEAKEVDPNDMMALFAESADAGKGPNLILEAVGDVTLDDLMEEVRQLREILSKRAA